MAHSAFQQLRWLTRARLGGPGRTLLRSLAGPIEVPTLVVSGEADLPSFMLMAEAYAKGIKRSRREIIQGTGHNVPFEAPEALNAILRDFLATI